MSDINFIDYDKISIQSDAFVSSDELNCYFQYIPSTKALSINIKKEKHTAGTTDDPNDYKIPDVKEKLSPKKLYRINPFHKNFAEELHLHKTNTDPEILYPTITKEVKVVDTDYSSMGLNQDQIDFLIALKNLKNLKVEDVSKKLDIDQFEITEDKLMEGFFQLYPRFMEQMVSSSGNLGNLNYEEEEPQESFGYSNDEKSMLDQHLKQMGLSSNDFKVKKNFQVRTGNSKDKLLNPFLQEKSLEKVTQNKVSIINNTENLSSINITNKNKFDLFNRLSVSTFTDNNNYKNFIQNINNTQKISVNQNIRVRQSTEQQKVDFEKIFNRLLKGLNLKNDITNFYNREINLHSKNLTFEFISQINQSFSKEYNTNIRNLTSAYNFYRHIENRYREFVQNLNFFNENFQEFKSTEYKIRNSYQNVHQHNFTQKNQINKNIINLTKEINFEKNMIDYSFQSAILKTVEKSNSITKINIEKIKESLSVVYNNVNYINNRVSNLYVEKKNKISKEVKNLINNQEFAENYSEIIINKISNIANNTEIKKLLSIIKNEETLQNLSYIVKQSSINIDNIKSISEIVNLSKSSNFNLSKISNESIQNVKNIISMADTFSKNYNISNVSNNITENLKELVNISQSQEFVVLSKSFKNISPVLKFISENKQNFRTSEISNINQITNLVNEVANVSQITNLVKQTNKIDKVSNFISEISNLQNLTEISNNIQRLSQVKDIKVFDELNIFTESKVNKSYKLLKRISKLRNINELEQNFSIVNQTLSENNDLHLKTSNVAQISKFLNLITNTKLDSKQITSLSKLSSQNIESTVQLINNITKNENSVNKISKIVNDILAVEENKLVKLSSLSQNQISNINLTKNEIQSVVRLEKQIKNYSEKVKIRETLKSLDLVEVRPEVNQFFANKFSTTKLNQISEILQNINLITNNKTLQQITKLGVQSNKNNITNNLNITEVLQTLNAIESNKKIYQQFNNKFSNMDVNQVTEILQSINLIKNNNLQHISKLNIASKNINISNIKNIDETVKAINLIESKSEINQLFTNKISLSNVNKISEVLQNINLIKNNKNLELITKFSFESNKKNISNIYNDLNVTMVQKNERKVERSFLSINKQIDRLYKMNERVERKAIRAEQSFYDLINFNDYSTSSKTSTKKDIKNFFQTLNLIKTNKEQIKEKVRESAKVNSFRITQSTEKVKIDIHKQKSQNYYKVENITKFEKKSYFEEKQEKEAQEKVIESKVEELLVKKIQNVTNNITNNVITKQEINIIKQEIIREIFKIEEKYDQKILAIKQETKQTVQNMLSQFLKS